MKRGFYEILSAPDAPGQLLAAWAVSGKAAGSKALFAAEKNRFVPVFRDEGFPDVCIKEIEDGNAGTGMTDISGTGIFLEKITRGRKLVICGGGHVSLPVIRIGRMLDFEVTVIEDREEFAQRAAQAGARHVICRSFEDALEGIPGDGATAFVIVTRAHTHDLECLRLILKKNFGYAGMMGSRRRTGLIREQLLAEDFDPERVGSVHMPIGLDIGSRTPEEIAVSVMAQIIQVMNASDSGEGFPEGMTEEICRLVSAGKTGDRQEPAGQISPAGVLAMIVEKNGEAPRKPGTKMLVRRDGSFLGTVGGGYAEAQILKRAKEMLDRNEKKPELVRIGMQKGVMMCGGEIAVFMLPLQ